jgi:hypothetical protein
MHGFSGQLLSHCGSRCLGSHDRRSCAAVRYLCGRARTMLVVQAAGMTLLATEHQRALSLKPELTGTSQKLSHAASACLERTMYSGTCSLWFCFPAFLWHMDTPVNDANRT